MRPEIYVERPIDRELLSALLAGEPCSVLGPPRMGYSCLARRTLAALHAEGRLALRADLASIGASPGSFIAGREEEQLFWGVLSDCFWDQPLVSALEAEWMALHTPPAERFHTLLAAIAPVVVMVDSGDMLRDLDALGGLGTRFHQAMQAPPPGVTFCLFAGNTSTAQPLASDPLRLGRVFTPADFTAEEAAALLPALQGLGRPGYPPTALLAEVLSWTSGDPYQTEALLFFLKHPPSDQVYEPNRLVATVVADRLDSLHRPYFTAWRQKQPQARVLSLLALYRRLLAGPQQLEPVERAEGESLVRLGMARWTPAGLAVRNDLTKLHYDTEYLAQAEERLRHREEVPCG